MTTSDSFMPESLAGYPRRIVCLTPETAEIIYSLGEQDRIVGVSGYTARPPEARFKPKVSAFTTAKMEKILDLKPDLALTFSDLQADIARELIWRGVPVVAFNQRSVPEILETVQTLGRLLGCAGRAQAVVGDLWEGLRTISASALRFPFRPKVFFEEWKDPMISGIQWVAELVEIAGGEPVFPDLKTCKLAKERIVTPAKVLARNPHVILASWCGMKVNKQLITSRDGWQQMTAVQRDYIFEISRLTFCSQALPR
jgi:iron complex transport system substrate-binding protein